MAASSRGQSGACACVCVCVWALLLGAAVSVATASEEYDYYGWQLDGAAGAGPGAGRGGVAGRGRPTCVDIPADLRLCHGVGYKRMRLPNLLDHDTLAEVRPQASSWVPLLAKRCHGDTQVFLCSLFAPVCLERPVLPCRSLCEAVRDACAPLMEAHGFPWPHMLSCAQFPPDNHLCIPMQHGNGPATQTPVSKVCPPCDNELKADTILEHFCASDFVLKLRVKELRRERGDRKLIVAQKKKKVLKLGVLRKKELKKLVLFIKNGANCPCPQLDAPSGAYLVMGRRVEQQLLVMAVHRWEKRSTELKIALKYIKTQQCPAYHAAFQ